MHPGFDRQPCDVAGLMCCLVNSNNDVLSKVWVRPPEDPMESPINQSERTELSTVEPTELPTIVEQLTGLNSYHVSIRLPDAMLALAAAEVGLDASQDGALVTLGSPRTAQVRIWVPNPLIQANTEEYTRRHLNVDACSAAAEIDHLLVRMPYSSKPGAHAPPPNLDQEKLPVQQMQILCRFCRASILKAQTLSHLRHAPRGFLDEVCGVGLPREQYRGRACH